MILICGEALFDIFPGAASGDDEDAIALRAVPGGSAYNVAIGLARLGRRVALATQLSDDHLGKQLEKMLAREGVDLSFVRRVAAPTPLALVETDEAGNPQYVFQGVRKISLDTPGAAERNERIVGLHVGSIPLVLEPSSGRLLKLISEAGASLVSLDPNVRLSVEPDSALWLRKLELFRRHANLVKVSLEDLEAIHGAGCNAEQIAGDWVEGETKVVVLTLGERGSLLFSHSGGRIEISPVPAAVVDTVGAGDSFQAGLLCWLGENRIADAGALSALTAEQLRSMAQFATVAAALTCSRKGSNMPRRSDIR